MEGRTKSFPKMRIKDFFALCNNDMQTRFHGVLGGEYGLG
jgi:hypothetical protein